MKLSTVSLAILAAVLLLTAGIAIGRLTGRPLAPVPDTPPASAAVPTADLTVPVMDVPGEDIAGLPPYPDMRRVEYRQVIMGDLLETEVEYVMEGDLEPVHDYFRGVFDAEGWDVADLHIFQGEWTFFVIKDEREALVELESRGPLVEVEIELTEPLPAEMSTGAGAP